MVVLAVVPVHEAFEPGLRFGQALEASGVAGVVLGGLKLGLAEGVAVAEPRSAGRSTDAQGPADPGEVLADHRCGVVGVEGRRAGSKALGQRGGFHQRRGVHGVLLVLEVPADHASAVEADDNAEAVPASACRSGDLGRSQVHTWLGRLAVSLGLARLAWRRRLRRSRTALFLRRIRYIEEIEGARPDSPDSPGPGHREPRRITRVRSRSTPSSPADSCVASAAERQADLTEATRQATDGSDGSDAEHRIPRTVGLFSNFDPWSADREARRGRTTLRNAGGVHCSIRFIRSIRGFARSGGRKLAAVRWLWPR